MDFSGHTPTDDCLRPRAGERNRRLVQPPDREEKKVATLPFLQAALSMNSAGDNRQLVDQAKFKDGLGKVIDGAVECLNASVWAKTK
jgi:hypothetical protein